MANEKKAIELLREAVEDTPKDIKAYVLIGINQDGSGEITTNLKEEVAFLFLKEVVKDIMSAKKNI